MSDLAIDSNYRQESDRELLKAILEILRCHLIFFLIVWLALFAPLFCQYHGLMINMGVAHQHGATESDQADGTLHFHQMASSVTMVMSLFVAAIPDALLLLSPIHIRWISPADAAMPAKLTLPTPDQPPR